MPASPERPFSRIRIHRLIEKAMWETEGVTPERLRSMLNRSTRFTHPEGNRRYHDYVFDVEGNVLYGVRKMRTVTDEIATLERPQSRVIEREGVRVREKPKFSELKPRLDKPAAILTKPSRAPGTVECSRCDGLGTETVMDPCEHCSPLNPGCAYCDEGLIRSTIQCQTCNGEGRIKPLR